MQIGLAGLLFLVFLVLKLTHVIDWSWWLVTLPLWGGFVLVVTVLVLGFFGVYLFDKKSEKKRSNK